MIKMLNACIKDSATHLAVFLMHEDGSARLDFIQNMEYKFVELLSCHFIPSCVWPAAALCSRRLA